MLLTYSDPLTLEHWAATIRTLFEDPAYEAGFDFLVDRRAAAPPSPEFAAGVAAFVKKHRQKFSTARVAIIVNDLAAFGMARMQEMLNEGAGLETRAFRSEAEARDWLGRTPPPGA